MPAKRLEELLDEWNLSPDGGGADPRHGSRSAVVPVRTEEGRPAVLKVASPGAEGGHEHLALRHWAGNGAVRLLRADPGRGVLLLERLHETDLTEGYDLEACEIVAGLYARLHVPAPPSLRTLGSLVARWTEQLSRLDRDVPIPRRLVEHAISVGGGFADDPATNGALIHTDLHYAHVLAADREPWLAIAPKPLSGDPHFEIAPMLWTRWADVAGQVRDGVRRRFDTIVDVAGLDEDRARAWVVLRVVHDATRTVTDPAYRGTPEDGARLTTRVAVAKAVQG